MRRIAVYLVCLALVVAGVVRVYRMGRWTDAYVALEAEIRRRAAEEARTYSILVPSGRVHLQQERFPIPSAVVTKPRRSPADEGAANGQQRLPAATTFVFFYANKIAN